jgi:hypothetical protein
MRRHGVRRALCVAGLGVLLLRSTASAIPIDDRGEMRLGLRAYTAVRIGTQEIGGEDNPLNWPHSAAGQMRQNRYFLQLDFDHDIKRLAKTSWGIAAPFRLLDPDELKYTVQYRYEGEGIYDWGPSQYRNPGDKLRAFRADTPNLPPLVDRRLPADYIERRVSKLNRVARQRSRLFLAYLDVQKGPVFFRIGRQVLAWGETDVFRLLDNINPLDDSFGGFFIALDERRVPLDMIRSNYNFGSFGPFSDAFLEGFVAAGDTVTQLPGTPGGSPWTPGGIGRPNTSIRQIVKVPDKDDVRGGARFVFTAADVTWTVAHYYTYFDIPGSQFKLPTVGANGTSLPVFGNEILAFVRYPRVPVTGASMTFPLEKLYSIVRSEAAYFQGEPMSRQGQGNPADANFAPGTPQARRLRGNLEGGVDPTVYPGLFFPTRDKPVWGTVLRRDTFNMSIGLDVNRFLRWLNPQQTFFISTQFFYKHVFDSPGDLVLPTPFRNLPADKDSPIVGNPGCFNRTRPCNIRPRFYHLDDDKFLHTLLITTSYFSGQMVPFFGMFYDWQGGIVVQPGVSLVRDPFRITIDYTNVMGPPTGQFGAVRDRDNVRAQVEFVF